MIRAIRYALNTRTPEHLVSFCSTADRFRGFKRPAASEDRQTFKDTLLRVRQKLITPIDSGCQGLLAGQRRTVSAGQKLESLIK